MAAVGVMTGLLIGGLLTQMLGWRSVFLVLAPGRRHLRRPRVLPEARADELPPRPDAAGALLVTTALMAIILGATGDRAHRRGFHRHRRASARRRRATRRVRTWEHRPNAPLVRFSILRVRSLRSASLGVGIDAITFTSIVYVGPLYLQGPLDYDPLEAGLALPPLDGTPCSSRWRPPEPSPPGPRASSWRHRSR